MEHLIYPPFEIEEYIKEFEFDVLPLVSMPNDLIPVFVEYRKKFRDVFKEVLNENTEEDDISEEKNYRFDALLLSKLPPPVKIPEKLVEFVKYDYNIFDYVYSDNIPSSLNLPLSLFKKKVEKHFFERFKNSFIEDIENDLRRKILKDAENENYPDLLFNYIRYDDVYKKIEQRPKNLSDLYKCNYKKIVSLPDIPSELKPFFKEFKDRTKRKEQVNKFIFKNRILDMPPEPLFGYIKYNEYKHTIYPKENMPSDLLPVFEEYKKYVEETKNKYWEEANKI